MQAQTTGEKDLAELEHYTLTVDNMARYGQVMDDLGTYSKAHPEFKANDDHEPGGESIADAERRISAQPVATAIFAKDGVSAHDFVVFGIALFQAAFAAETARQNNIPMANMAADGHVNPANLIFVQEHKAEIEALEAKIKGSTAKGDKSSNQ